MFPTLSTSRLASTPKKKFSPWVVLPLQPLQSWEPTLIVSLVPTDSNDLNLSAYFDIQEEEKKQKKEHKSDAQAKTHS